MIQRKGTNYRRLKLSWMEHMQTRLIRRPILVTFNLVTTSTKLTTIQLLGALVEADC